MRQVGKEPQIRHLVEDIEGEEQVGGHPIAVGFHQNRKVDVLGEALPALQDWNAFGQETRSDIRL
jgi:hypothetical protein